MGTEQTDRTAEANTDTRSAVSVTPAASVLPVRVAWAGVAVMATAVVLLALGMNLLGEHSRRIDPASDKPRIMRASTAVETVNLTALANLHGDVLVDATGVFRYHEVPIREVAPTPGYPVANIDLLAAYQSKVASENLVWVLAKDDVARHVRYVMTPSGLARKIEEGRAAGLPGIAAGGDSIEANDDGYLRVATSTVPHLGVPVVLLVDASYFETGTPESLAEQLRAAALDIRLIITYEATDDATVPDSSRVALRRFVSMAADGGLR